MKRTRCLAALAVVLAAQQTSWAQTSEAGNASPLEMQVRQVTHGFGALLPHRIAVPDASGNPTTTIVAIHSVDELAQLVTPSNPVRPIPAWPIIPVSPTGAPGNHYVHVSFTRPIGVGSVLDATPAGQASFGLLGSLTVVASDPVTGATFPVAGRAFIGGHTHAGTPAGSPPTLPFQPWVRRLNGQLVANPAVDNDGDGVPDGLGFPGTEGPAIVGEVGLVARQSFVFVADTDGDLQTYETFPPGLQISVRMTTAIQDNMGEALAVQAVATSTVGPDTLGPAVAFDPLSGGPAIVPGNGDLGVSPDTDVVIRFTESMQPLSVGSILGNPPPLSPAVRLAYFLLGQSVPVPFNARPVSHLDLTTFVLEPAFDFPGDDTQVSVDVNPNQSRDLNGNTNPTSVASFFVTGPGPGVVNGPVAPEAIYVARSGAEVGLSVIDLNGFGGSTGSPIFDIINYVEANTHYPYNPNVLFQGASLVPPLFVGSSNLDGGSRGVFTLTGDSSLNDKLLRAPLVDSVGDMMLGAPLDLAINNGQGPGGCQGGGGNLCAIDGLQLLSVDVVGPPLALAPTLPGGSPDHQVANAGNPISFAPHPNPPPLVFPPLCGTPLIGGLEPTRPGVATLLVSGDPFGDPNLGIPPSGLLGEGRVSYFLGPNLPGTPLSQCGTFQMRQQIGHFLYVIDRVRGEVVVLNSNRMHVLERIALPDPTSLAMSPELDLLAVTNESVGTVSFIDIRPDSAQFHTVVATTAVGNGPNGIAWEPGNEDILVCNEVDGSVAVLSAFNLQVRKVLTAHLTQPFEVAIAPRQQAFGLLRNVYFAYVLDRDGSVAVFESGPNGINGWGFDDILGTVPFSYPSPRAIQVDPSDLNSGVWIAHEDGAGGGALSNLRLDSGTSGMIPLSPGEAPSFRDMTYTSSTLTETVLSGVPTDVAFDDLVNLGALPNTHSPFSAGSPAQANGKGLVRSFVGTFFATSRPDYLFVPVPSAGVVDVIDLDTLQIVDTNPFQAGTQSIPADGADRVAGYFRQ